MTFLAKKAQPKTDDETVSVHALRQRVRELEAELAGTQSTVRTLLDERHEQLARAEKAEALAKHLQEALDDEKLERERAETRVAELEGRLLTVAGMKPVSVRQKAAWDAWLEEHPAREPEEG